MKSKYQQIIHKGPAKHVSVSVGCSWYNVHDLLNHQVAFDLQPLFLVCFCLPFRYYVIIGYYVVNLRFGFGRKNFGFEAFNPPAGKEVEARLLLVSLGEPAGFLCNFLTK